MTHEDRVEWALRYATKAVDSSLQCGLLPLESYWNIYLSALREKQRLENQAFIGLAKEPK